MSTAGSGLGFSVFVDFNYDEAIHFLDAFGTSLHDVSGGPMGDGIAAAALDWQHDLRIRFAVLSQGDGSWHELSTKYAARKIKELGHDLILFYSGDMARSLEPDMPNNYFLQHPEGAVFGSEDPKIEYHEYGTEKMDARPVYVLPDDPDMPWGTLDRMHIDIEQGTLAMIEHCISGI